MEDWLCIQAQDTAVSWDNVIQTHYPAYWPDWSIPERHLSALRERWNYQAAAEAFDWMPYLSKDSMTVLDLGAGTGWLSAMLSLLPGIGHIDALDSSKFNLEFMMPRVVALLGASMAKIHPIRGLFTPILKPNDHYDLIVASSAFHHASDLLHLLKECHRVLKPGAKAVILNETPMSRYAYIRLGSRMFVSLIKGVLQSRFVDRAPTISLFGVKYDPYLGDVAYADYHWRQAIEAAGFEFERIDSGISPYRPHADNPTNAGHLVHFVCRKRHVKNSSEKTRGNGV